LMSSPRLSNARLPEPGTSCLSCALTARLAALVFPAQTALPRLNLRLFCRSSCCRYGREPAPGAWWRGGTVEVEGVDMGSAAGPAAMRCGPRWQAGCQTAAPGR
jgi:hypothetical protein